MIVMKFGGTSLKNAERIEIAVDIIKSRLDKKPVVVCSATSGTTNQLVEMGDVAFSGRPTKKNQEAIRAKHDKIIEELGLEKSIIDDIFSEIKDTMARIKERTAKNSDNILSFGERISVRIVAAYMNKIGVKAKAYDAFDIGMITDDNHGNAEPLEKAYEVIREKIGELDHIPIITGYIGKNEAGEITTLSRGGSDYTAAIVGAAVSAEEVQIWTDVDGVMTTNPKVVPNAQTIECLSFNEASELAIFGAKVLHPKSLIPSMQKNIPVRVLNTYNAEGEGTVILSEAQKCVGGVKAIACKKGVSLVNITSTRMLQAHGYLAKIFEVFAANNKSVDMISTSEVSVSMTINEPEGMDKIVKELQGIATVKLEENKAIVCVVGEGMKNSVGTAGKVFNSVAESGVSVEMVSQGASEINIGFVVAEEKADDVVKQLHSEFIG